MAEQMVGDRMVELGDRMVELGDRMVERGRCHGITGEA
jgi:hypothetical protein